MEYVMLSVKAKQDWVPFGYQIKELEMGHDIDFSLIEFKVPIITDMTGFYKGFIYQFSEDSLTKLSAQLH